jgi:TRAP-type C4-dicarboxylate transport system substrate-binding protein
LLVPFPSECRDRKVEIPRPLGRNGGTKCLGSQAFPFGKAACPGVLIPFILVLMICLFVGSLSFAERPVMRISVENTDAHVQTIAVRRFAELVDQRLGDRLEVQCYSSASLFRDSEIVKALARGRVEMGVPGTWQIDPFVPEVGVFQLPAFYGTRPEVVYQFLEGEVGRDLKALIEEELFVVIPGSWMDLGFTHLFSTEKPIRTYKDIEEMRIRVAGGYVNEARIARMGGIPVIIPWPDLPSRLEQKQVFGLLTSYETIRSAALWEKGIRYAFEDRQYFAQYIPMIADHFWDNLSPEMQSVLTECWETAASEQRTAAAEAQKSAREELIRQGVLITVPEPEEVLTMKQKLLEQQDTIAETLGIPQDLVNALEEFMRAADAPDNQ